MLHENHFKRAFSFNLASYQPFHKSISLLFRQTIYIGYSISCYVFNIKHTLFVLFWTLVYLSVFHQSGLIVNVNFFLFFSFFFHPHTLNLHDLPFGGTSYILACWLDVHIAWLSPSKGDSKSDDVIKLLEWVVVDLLL